MRKAETQTVLVKDLGLRIEFPAGMTPEQIRHALQTDPQITKLYAQQKVGEGLAGQGFVSKFGETPRGRQGVVPDVPGTVAAARAAQRGLPLWQKGLGALSGALDAALLGDPTSEGRLSSLGAIGESAGDVSSRRASQPGVTRDLREYLASRPFAERFEYAQGQGPAAFDPAGFTSRMLAARQAGGAFQAVNAAEALPDQILGDPINALPVGGVMGLFGKGAKAATTGLFGAQAAYGLYHAARSPYPEEELPGAGANALLFGLGLLGGRRARTNAPSAPEAPRGLPPGPGEGPRGLPGEGGARPNAQRPAAEATPAGVKAAWRDLQREAHPDQHAGTNWEATAAEVSRKANEIYQGPGTPEQKTAGLDALRTVWEAFKAGNPRTATETTTTEPNAPPAPPKSGEPPAAKTAPADHRSPKEAGLAAEADTFTPAPVTEASGGFRLSDKSVKTHDLGTGGPGIPVETYAIRTPGGDAAGEIQITKLGELASIHWLGETGGNADQPLSELSNKIGFAGLSDIIRQYVSENPEITHIGGFRAGGRKYDNPQNEVIPVERFLKRPRAASAPAAQRPTPNHPTTQPPSPEDRFRAAVRKVVEAGKPITGSQLRDNAARMGVSKGVAQTIYAEELDAHEQRKADAVYEKRYGHPRPAKGAEREPTAADVGRVAVEEADVLGPEAVRETSGPADAPQQLYHDPTDWGAMAREDLRSGAHSPESALATAAEFEANGDPASANAIRAAVAAHKTAHKTVSGNAGTAYTPDNTPVGFHYAIVSLDDLVPSHTDNFAPTPGYDQAIQPRDHTRQASRDRVAKMASELNPERLGEAATTAEGSPVIGPDNRVESGNTRTMSMRAARAAHPERWAEYQKWLAENAAKFGVDAAALSGVSDPVLVRVRESVGGKKELTAEERSAFAAEAGASTVAERGETEIARTDAESLTRGNLLELLVGDDPLAASNLDFRKAFLSGIPLSERGPLQLPEGGLSQKGMRRITNAVLAAAYSDPHVITRLTESADKVLLNMGNGLRQMAGRIARVKGRIAAGELYPIDISGEIAEAANALWRTKGISAAEIGPGTRKKAAAEGISPEVYYFLQNSGAGDLYSEGMSGIGAELLLWIDKNRRSAKGIRELLDAYYDVAELNPVPKQENLFGEKPPPAPTKGEALAAAQLGVAKGAENGEADTTGSVFGEGAAGGGEASAAERGSGADGETRAEGGAGFQNPYRTYGGLDPELIRQMPKAVFDLARMLYGAGRTFAQFAREAVRKFGNAVKRYLSGAWKMAAESPNIDAPPDVHDLGYGARFRTPTDTPGNPGTYTKVSGKPRLSEIFKGAQRRQQELLHSRMTQFDAVIAFLDRAQKAAGNLDTDAFRADFVRLVERKFDDPARAATGDLGRALKAYDALADELRRSLFRERSDRLPKLYQTLREETWGIRDRGYFPHQFPGNWRVEVEGSANLWTARNRKEAMQIAAELEKANPGAKVTVSTFDIPENPAYAGAKAKFFGARLQRSGRAGYATDFARVLRTHIAQQTRAEVLTRLNKLLQPEIAALREGKGTPGGVKLPRLADEVQSHVNDLWGQPHEWEKRLSPDNPLVFRQAARRIMDIQRHLKLSLNLSSAGVNLLQVSKTLWPYATAGEIRQVYASLSKSSVREALRTRGVWDGATKLEGDTARLGARLQTPFEWASNVNRGAAYLFGRRKATAAGKSAAEAHRIGMEWAEKVEFDNSLYSAPPLFRDPIARLLGQFKSFTIKDAEAAVALLHDVPGLPNGKRDKTVRVAKWLTAQIGQGGVKSLSGLAIAAGLVGAYTLVAGTSAALQGLGMDEETANRLARDFHYGVGAEFGADLSAKVGFLEPPYGNNRSERAVNFFGGPTVGSTFAIWDFIAAAAQGDGEKAQKAVERVTPYAKFGDVLGGLSGEGRDVGDVEISPVERALRGVGVQPLKVSEAYDQK